MSILDRHYAPETARLVDAGTLALREHQQRKIRGHLGLSEIGHEDLRTLWLKFRWSLPDEITPRQARIFWLGDAIEDYVGAIFHHGRLPLRTTNKETGKQFHVAILGGHFSGSCDGLLDGILDDPKAEHVFECKSANDDSFKEAVKNGIELWNRQYWIQAQGYMATFGCRWCLFVVFNKDTSELYFERVPAVHGAWESSVIRAGDVLQEPAPPESIYKPTDYRLKNFKSEEYQRVYWLKDLPKPNCRNCQHAEPLLEGEGGIWQCHRHGHAIAKEQQLTGCPTHVYMPAMVAERIGDLVQQYQGINVYQFKKSSAQFWNAESLDGYLGSMVFSSEEMHALTHRQMFRPDTITADMLAIRDRFGGSLLDIELDERPQPQQEDDAA